MSLRRNWRLIQAVISGVLILWLFSKVDFRTSLSQLAGVPLNLALLALSVSFIQWAVVNSLCWYVLLRGIHVRISFLRLARANFSGLFYSLFLPGQVSGDVIKGIQLAVEKNQTVQFLLSILMDRLTGFWVTLAISIVAVFTTGWMAHYVSPAVFGTTLAFLLAISLLFFFRPLLGFWSKLLVAASRLRVFRFATNPLLTLGECIQRYYILSPHVLMAILISMVSLLTGSLIVCLGALSLGIYQPFWVFLFVTAILSAIQTLPISIAGIGVREAGYVLLFEPLGVPSESSLALSAMMFTVFVITALCGGLLELVDTLRKPSDPPNQSERRGHAIQRDGQTPTS